MLSFVAMVMARATPVPTAENDDNGAGPLWSTADPEGPVVSICSKTERLVNLA